MQYQKIMPFSDRKEYQKTYIIMDIQKARVYKKGVK